MSFSAIYNINHIIKKLLYSYALNDIQFYFNNLIKYATLIYFLNLQLVHEILSMLLLNNHLQTKKLFN